MAGKHVFLHLSALRVHPTVKIVRLVRQEGHAALGALPRDVREPEELVRRTKRAEALPPDSGRRLEEREKSSTLVHSQVHSRGVPHSSHKELAV